jgi:hypothetical protein
MKRARPAAAAQTETFHFSYESARRQKFEIPAAALRVLLLLPKNKGGGCIASVGEEMGAVKKAIQALLCSWLYSGTCYLEDY